MVACSSSPRRANFFLRNLFMTPLSRKEFLRLAAAGASVMALNACGIKEVPSTPAPALTDTAQPDQPPASTQTNVPATRTLAPTATPGPTDTPFPSPTASPESGPDLVVARNGER